MVGVNLAKKLLLKSLGDDDKPCAIVVEAFAAGPPRIYKNEEVSGHGILLQDVFYLRKQ
jgi:hypothetical protein